MNDTSTSDPSGSAPPDLFLSYAREDRATAQQLAHALGEEGFSVWWDREIRGGSDFTEEIAAKLQAARRVIVLWSPKAVASSFVRDESARARDAGKLLPVRIEEVDLPLGFGQLQTLDLIDWDGEREAMEFRAVVNEVRHAFGHKVTTLPGGSKRRIRLRKLMWPAILIAVVGLGYVGLQWQNQARAERFFQDGVAAQFAAQANLESARNNYLSALELRPGHARTHYYLGHVYAQLQLLDAARADFDMAVRLGRGLDASQIADARKQLAVLSVPSEPAAITRSIARPSQPPELEAPAPVAEAPSSEDSATVPGRVVMRPTSPALGAEGFPRLGGLPHVPPDAETNARIEPLVTQMFAPDKQARISATTSLIVDAALASDAAPLAIKAALSFQRNMPGDAAGRATAQSGVINTLVLLRSVSPMTLRKHADDVRALLELARPNGSQTAEIADEVAVRLKTAMAQRPVAWIQIANEAQRPLAERLARRLREVGYDAPGVENVGDRSPATRSEIRTQGNSDQALARWEAQAMRKLDLGDPKLTVLRKATPKVDTYEIWFDRELCVKRVVAGCAPVPS
ncbi:MAG: toll/interleukin-1 receptor domain-containing protein [Thiobacillus sp.]